MTAWCVVLPWLWFGGRVGLDVWWLRMTVTVAVDACVRVSVGMPAFTCLPTAPLHTTTHRRFSPIPLPLPTCYCRRHAYHHRARTAAAPATLYLRCRALPRTAYARLPPPVLLPTTDGPAASRCFYCIWDLKADGIAEMILAVPLICCL